MAKGKFISYLRVSTDKQGRSGLGTGSCNGPPSTAISMEAVGPCCAKYA